MAAVLLQIALYVAQQRHIHDRRDGQEDGGTAPDDDCEDHRA